jgi:hypothetical protein
MQLNEAGTETSIQISQLTGLAEISLGTIRAPVGHAMGTAFTPMDSMTIALLGICARRGTEISSNPFPEMEKSFLEINLST